MNKQFIEDCLRTESPTTEQLQKRLTDVTRLLHGAIGIATESGELLDQIKKHVFYGKALDVDNIKEELGDLFWYIAIIIDSLDIEPEGPMKIVIAKLKVRYPEKFNCPNALFRSLGEERKAIENAAKLVEEKILCDVCGKVIDSTKVNNCVCFNND